MNWAQGPGKDVPAGAEGGGLDGHAEQLGLPPGGSGEPLKASEQGRDTVKAAL